MEQQAGKQRAWGVDTYSKWDNLDSDEEDNIEREEAKTTSTLTKNAARKGRDEIAGPREESKAAPATHFDFGDGKIDVEERNLAGEVLEDATRKRIRGLSQNKNEIWQVVVRKLRAWCAASGTSAHDEADDSARPCRPYAVTISCLYPEGRLVAQHVCEPPERPPDGAQVLSFLSRAFLNPAAGAQRRPKAVTFPDVGLAGSLFRGLESLGIETSQLSESEGIDEVVSKFSDLLVKKGIASVGPTSENSGLGAVLPRCEGPIRAAYAAAADLARAEPWKRWHERRIFRLATKDESAWVSILGRDGGGTFGLALFFSRLDAEARLTPDGEGVYRRATDALPRCSFTGQTEADLGRALKRTKPRKMDIRTGEELMYADADALRSHWPAVRKFAIAIDEVEAGRKQARKYWLGQEATILFEDVTLVPFDDLDSIEADELDVVGADEAPSLRNQRYPVFLNFKNGQPVAMDPHVLAWLERAARAALALYQQNNFDESPPFTTLVSLRDGDVDVASSPIFLESEARAAIAARAGKRTEEAAAEEVAANDAAVDEVAANDIGPQRQIGGDDSGPVARAEPAGIADGSSRDVSAATSVAEGKPCSIS